MRKRSAIGAGYGAILWWTALSHPAFAGNTGPEALVAGVPGADLVRARCTLCHEAGHITRARLTLSEWEDTVRLMIRRGAPIAPEELPAILDYLTTHYGRAAN